MANLTPEGKKEIIRKLQVEYNTDEVEFHGYNRFVVRERTQLVNDHTWLYKDKLFDEVGNIIPLENEYNNIFMFTSGVAVVCTRENIKIEGGRFTQTQKDGLIDINGKELLPCVFDSIHIHFGGPVDITKNGEKRFVSQNVIENGKFNWDEAIPY